MRHGLGAMRSCSWRSQPTSDLQPVRAAGRIFTESLWHVRYSGLMATARDVAGYAWAAAAVACCTLAGWWMHPRFDLVNVAMVYLLGVVLVALRFPLGPAIATAVGSVACLDLLFVPPMGTFRVDDLQYLLAFAIMVVVAVVIVRLVEGTRRESAARNLLAIESERERLRSTLLASISHDLRTPLAVVAGASSSLAESGERMPAAERDTLARSIFRQSTQMSEHVGKILQMTRLDTGAIVPDRDWSAMPEIVATALDLQREHLAQRRVIVELPEDLPLVRADASLLVQVFANLLDNAARHTPAGTVVRIHARHEGDEMLATVEDYGDALAEADVERVFAKFHRGTPAPGGSDAGHGVGLGLSICRAIVALHGGRTWAQRVPGGGAAFHFTLPLEPVPPVPREAT